MKKKFKNKFNKKKFLGIGLAHNLYINHKKYFDPLKYKASKSHWQILAKLEMPKSLTRLANLHSQSSAAINLLRNQMQAIKLYQIIIDHIRLDYSLSTCNCLLFVIVTCSLNYILKVSLQVICLKISNFKFKDQVLSYEYNF